MRVVVEAPQLFALEVPPDIRIAHLKRFPFSILFRANNIGVEVLAVAHHRRAPRYWEARK